MSNIVSDKLMMFMNNFNNEKIINISFYTDNKNTLIIFTPEPQIPIQVVSSVI